MLGGYDYNWGAREQVMSRKLLPITASTLMMLFRLPSTGQGHFKVTKAVFPRGSMYPRIRLGIWVILMIVQVFG